MIFEHPPKTMDNAYVEPPHCIKDSACRKSEATLREVNMKRLPQPLEGLGDEQSCPPSQCALPRCLVPRTFLKVSFSQESPGSSYQLYKLAALKQIIPKEPQLGNLCFSQSVSR